MTIIITYQWRQIRNFWRQLGLRVQLEIVFLFIIFFSFFTDKCNTLFTQWLAGPGVTAGGLSGLLVHAIMIVSLFSSPLIYFNLIPRQKGFQILGNQPLSSRQVLTLLMFLYMKYQLLILIITLPVFTALWLSTSIWQLFYALTLFVLSFIFSLLLVHLLDEKSWTYTQKIISYYLITTLYLIAYFLLYQLTDFALYFDLLVILIGAGILYKSWRFSWRSWDLLVGRARLVLEKTTRQVSGLTYFTFPHRIPPRFRPLLIKELLSYFRNRKYQRLKLITVFVYILALIGSSIYFPDDFLSAVSLLTFIVIWEHYTHQFNEKYVTKDPALFYKTLPVKFRHLILSKFFSEFIFIISIVLILFLWLLLQGVGITLLLMYCLLIILISSFILYIIILLRLIFYDRPRFAGYAYHLLVVFMLVMNLTYYLVGPVISILILVYLNYNSYRQFVK